MTEHDPDGNAVLLAILALLVDEREARLAERPEASKTETILSDCGLDATAIARVVGKKPSSVRAVLSRERTSDKSKSPKDPVA